MDGSATVPLRKSPRLNTSQEHREAGDAQPSPTQAATVVPLPQTQAVCPARRPPKPNIKLWISTRGTPRGSGLSGCIEHNLVRPINLATTRLSTQPAPVAPVTGPATVPVAPVTGPEKVLVAPVTGPATVSVAPVTGAATVPVAPVTEPEKVLVAPVTGPATVPDAPVTGPMTVPVTPVTGLTPVSMEASTLLPESTPQPDVLQPPVSIKPRKGKRGKPVDCNPVVRRRSKRLNPGDAGGPSSTETATKELDPTPKPQPHPSPITPTSDPLSSQTRAESVSSAKIFLGPNPSNPRFKPKKRMMKGQTSKMAAEGPSKSTPRREGSVFQPSPQQETLVDAGATTSPSSDDRDLMTEASQTDPTRRMATSAEDANESFTEAQVAKLVVDAISAEHHAFFKDIAAREERHKAEMAEIKKQNERNNKQIEELFRRVGIKPPVFGESSNGQHGGGDNSGGGNA